ncbi:hypothetical protein ACQR3P_28820 [Rhodococcus sp. IEGM1300]
MTNQQEQKSVFYAINYLREETKKLGEFITAQPDHNLIDLLNGRKRELDYDLEELEKIQSEFHL